MTVQEFNDEAAAVCRAMRIYGGSFMQAIGDAVNVADLEDKTKIKKTWPREWQQYLKMAEAMNDDS